MLTSAMQSRARASDRLNDDVSKRLTQPRGFAVLLLPVAVFREGRRS